MIKKMLCEVCKENEHKYRCPPCRIVYCSLACYKLHKESCAGKVKEDQPPTEGPIVPLLNTEPAPMPVPEFTLQEDESRDRVSTDQLQRLENSEEVKAALENPHLRQIMSSLVAAKNVDKLLDSAMQEPIFSEFADTCLETINPRVSSID